MLYLHTSNQLEQLAKQFCMVSQQPRSIKSVFERETVIVQNAGMARWLSLQVADYTGISANMETLFPAEFMWQTLRSVLPDLPDHDPCKPTVLRWRLLQLFIDCLNDHEDDFPEIAHYLNDETNAWHLALELSQQLDHYLFYRDDWIHQWESVDNDELLKNNWQARLWRKIVTENGLVHWLSMQDQFIQALGAHSSSNTVNMLPERVSFFSLSALSPGYLRLLGELGKRIDIHLFIINPCQEYWGDILSEKQIARLDATEQAYYESGNPLLASMGKQGRDFLDQCLELPDIQVIDQWQVNQQPDTLLQHVQQDILDLRYPVTQRLGVDGALVDETEGSLSADGSIQFHACHTPLREVEVLHDQILDILQQQPDIAPADIIVMMPDVDQYAPYIESVFSSPVAAHSTQTLPFSIADKSPAHAQQMIEAMLKIMDLNETRFDVESVFELLDYESIRKRFNLQAHDVVTCRELARSTNIRWGISATSRSKNNLPNTAEHTWRYALERMLLGYMMPGELLFTPDSEYHNHLPLLPFDHIEGSTAQILASLKQFTDSLFRLDEWSSQCLTLQDWLQKIRYLIKDLFDENDDYSALLEMLDSLGQQIELAELDAELPFPVMRKIIKNSLLEISGNEQYLGYGITFCALVPMRSVPFKVVVLLGMNDGDFPRQDTHHSFDLMANKPRKGDRSRRDEDRYLFLESILAARQKLIISFMGQSIKDNSTLPPSVLVSELLESLNDYTATPGSSEHWIIKHPLQSFSPRYFGNDPALFSYASEYASLYQQRAAGASSAASDNFISKPLKALDDQHKQVSVDDFINFFINPARSFLKQRFSIQTYDNELLLSIREPFELARFDDVKIRDQLLTASYHQATESDQQMDTANAIQVSRAKGLLPYGNIGDQDFSHEQQLIETFVRQLPATMPQQTCAIKLTIDGFTLSGKIRHLDIPTDKNGIEQHIIHTGQPYTKEMITLWLNHLVLNAHTDDNTTSHFYSPEQSFSLIPVIDARQQLGNLLEYYWQGLHFPLKFFPKPALKMIEKNPQKPDIKTAITSWENNYFGHSEKDKFENWLLYRDLSHEELFADEFLAVSKLLFGTLFESMYSV